MMTSNENMAKPLPRPVTALLLLALLTAFLPHRERALLLTEAGLDTLLTTDVLASNSFISPAPIGYYNGERLGWLPGSDEPRALRRERNAPGRSLYAGGPALVLPTIPGGRTVQSVIPLGNAIPGAAPVLSSGTPPPDGGAGNPAAPPSGTFPGGGGGFGGGGGSGGSISTPGEPVVPPVAVVPEPTTWALMILGFGLIGHALRRSRRRLHVPV